MNQVCQMGRLTRDPEIKTTTNGVDVVNFAIAVKRNFAKSGEKDTDYFECVAWRHTANYVATYLSKGDLIGISGELRQNSYTDSEGKKKQHVEILVTQVTGCKSKTATDFTAADVDFNGTPFDDIPGEEVG